MERQQEHAQQKAAQRQALEAEHASASAKEDCRASSPLLHEMLDARVQAVPELWPAR